MCDKNEYTHKIIQLYFQQKKVLLIFIQSLLQEKVKYIYNITRRISILILVIQVEVIAT